MLLIVLAFMINDNKNVDNAAEIYMRFSESKIDSQHKALAVRQIESIVNTQVYSPFSYFYRLNAEYLEWSELFVG
jgi:hypothetical protein